MPHFERVAIVHDWLVSYAGAEKVLREIIAVFPQADIFALVDFLGADDRQKLFGKQVQTSFIQKLPWARKKYRSYLPLMPLAVEQFDVSGYDLVISSSHAVAKAVLTGPDQLHICYCHTPIRYAWDMQHQYLRQAGLAHGGKSIVARLVLHYIRLWDNRTANGVDHFIANSNYIARRIRKVYGRAASVIHPPVDIEKFFLAQQKEEFYFTASRMVPYKRIDLIVRAFAAMPDKQLIVIGDGPEMQRIKKLAASNIRLLGHQPDAVLREHLQRAKAFVFAAEEDFGILPVEAQACGTPVIAYGRGGVLDSIVDIDNTGALPPTGLFFAAQTVDAICNAVRRFETLVEKFSPQACRDKAAQFSPEIFRQALRQAVGH